MKTTFGFWDVDTQVDFILPTGALHVPAAEKLIPNLRKLTSFAKRHRITVVATRDAHSLEDPEFRQFPPHCVKGSAGAKKIPETTFAGQIEICKQTFDAFDRPESDEVLRRTGIDDWVVYGVATDYCVRAAVLGLAMRGCGVTVVKDAVRGITPESTEKAVNEMKAAGARFACTSAVIAQLTRKLASKMKHLETQAR